MRIRDYPPPTSLEKRMGIGGGRAFIDSDDNKALMVRHQWLFYLNLLKMGMDKDRAANNI